MLTKRIVPCLDVKNGRTVKGVNFVNLIDAGDPVELAKRYAEEGADELVFLDISATLEERKTQQVWVSDVAKQINIPFTVGGGVASLDDVYRLLDSGADKVSLNSAVVFNPTLLDQLSKNFGCQCLVVAIDSKSEDGKNFVYTHGGTKRTEKLTLEWAKEMQERGAGEILLTSMDHDGTKTGFALTLTREMSELVHIPIIASGGGGTLAHFLSVFNEGKADAALAASVFHFQEINIQYLKRYLKENGLPVRI